MGSTATSIAAPADSRTHGAAYDRILTALRAEGKQVKDSGHKAIAQCPAHDDGRPSLSITGTEGQTLIHCFAGCQTEEVMAALNMATRDLFDHAQGITYRYDDGREVQRTPDKRFYQRHVTVIPELYRRGKVLEAVAQERTVYLVEGEKDVHALEAVGVVATTAPQGAQSIGKADLTPLHGAKVVAVVDNDPQGTTWAQNVAHALEGRCQSLTFTRAAIGKDVADHIAAGHTVADLERIDLADLEPAQASSSTEPPLEAAGATWEPVPLADIIDGLLAGTYTRLAPTVAPRDDGQCLFYAGKVNGIAGESSAGKTWTALYAAHSEIAQGRNVVYIDFEDGPAEMVARLLDLGAKPDHIRDHFTYLQPDERLGTLARAVLDQAVKAAAPSLVVIDSTGESMALEGAGPNKDDETAVWFRMFPTRIANTGPAVLVLDHLTKADPAALSPGGSQRKRAAINGAQYTQVEVIPFARGVPGKAKLLCAKDRHGTYTRGDAVAEVVVTPTGSASGLRIRLSTPTGSSNTPFRPTGLMERVAEALAASPDPLTTRALLEQVKGKQQHVRQAIDTLAAEGYVRITDGPNRSKNHELTRPYSQSTDPLSDVYIPPLPSVAGGCVPSLEGEGDTHTEPATGHTGDTQGHTGTKPQDHAETARDTQETLLLDSDSGVSQVYPAEKTPQNGICNNCNFPLSGRPGSRFCEPDHAQAPGSVTS